MGNHDGMSRFGVLCVHLVPRAVVRSGSGWQLQTFLFWNTVRSGDIACMGAPRSPLFDRRDLDWGGI